MRVLLASIGTAGDVHPFLAIGRSLAARGHRVELISNPVFAPLAAAAGIGFLPVGSEQHFAAAFAHHYIWHPVNGFGVMWRYLARPAIPEAYRHIEAAQREGPCVVLYSPFLMPAARIAQERLGVAAVTAYTAPAMIPNYSAPLCLTRWRLPRGTPRLLSRFAVRELDRRKMQPLALPAVEAQRAALGLAPLEVSIFGEWLHSPLLGITLFPQWFAASTRDWPTPVMQAGFPLWDGDTAAGMPAALAEFLAAGTPPLVFTAGTAMRHGAAFFEAAVRASRALGERAILLTREAAQVPADLPASVLHVPYAPFALLLPAARALIHHGGIGSSAQALRAGVPQLVVPHAYDQFDNAMRLEQLGVARSVGAADSGAARLARELRALLRDGRVAAACAGAALRMKHEDPMQHIISALEGLA